MIWSAFRPSSPGTRHFSLPRMLAVKLFTMPSCHVSSTLVCMAWTGRSITHAGFDRNATSGRPGMTDIASVPFSP